MPETGMPDEDQACLDEHTSRHLGIILKRARHKMNLSQNSLSEAANINNSYYCSIERGTVNVTVRKLISICDGLQIMPEEVMRTLHHFQESKNEYEDRKK